MRWRCGDCKGSLDKLRSAPMVRDDLWRAIACDRDRRLCDACLRHRMRRVLGRTLCLDDLTTCRFNVMTGHLHELTSPGKQRADYEAGVYAFERHQQALQSTPGASAMTSDDELPCFKCEHPDAWKVRKQIIEVVMGVMDGTPLPPPPDHRGGDLPVDCCQRKPRLVAP